MTWQAYASTRSRLRWMAALSTVGFFACASPTSTGPGNGGTNGGGTAGTTGAAGSNGAGHGGTTGSGNSGGPGNGGTTGSAGSTGPGNGGTTGSAGSTGPGNGGTTGSAGNSGPGNGGRGGTTGSAGSTGPGNGGTTGTAGTTGSAGRGGTTGTGGVGGGTAGRGGTTGTGGGSGGAAGAGCMNTDQNVLNEDSSGYVCNNKWGIKGAWYCYSDGADTTISCKGSDGKGMGAVPWNAGSSAMCLSGTMGTGSGSYAGIGFKVNSGPPGDTTAPGVWNASSIVGFAITLQSGASGKGSGGMILNLEYPTPNDMDPNTKDAPGITVPGVPTSGTITYNALFADAVLANNANNRKSVDASNLSDVKIAFFPDSISHSYDFCIKSVVPIMSAPNPVVAVGNYGPTWNNQQPQAVNGINGYAVQSAPFPQNGNPMTMQVKATSGGVGFTYTTGNGFNAPNNGPGAFPAIISGWGPGHDGIQFYGPYKTAKTIGSLTTVKSSWSFTMGTSGNAVFDLWFGNSATPAVPNAELMIWIGNKDKMPIGYGGSTSSCTNGVAFGGRTPYCGTNGTGEKVVSYWVPTNTNGSPVTDFDILSYVKDAASHGYAGLSSSSYMIGVQTGFEVYSGSWSTSDYNITIQ